MTAIGAPSIHSGEWDPVFAACVETGTVQSTEARERMHEALGAGAPVRRDQLGGGTRQHVVDGAARVHADEVAIERIGQPHAAAPA